MEKPLIELFTKSQMDWLNIHLCSVPPSNFMAKRWEKLKDGKQKRWKKRKEWRINRRSLCFYSYLFRNLGPGFPRSGGLFLLCQQPDCSEECGSVSHSKQRSTIFLGLFILLYSSLDVARPTLINPCPAPSRLFPQVTLKSMGHNPPVLTHL